MKVEIKVFNHGIGQSRKVFRIPRFTLPQLIAKAEKMFAKNKNATFTIEEI